MSIQSKLVYGLAVLILLVWIVGIMNWWWAGRNQVVYGIGVLIVLCLVACIIAAWWTERKRDKVKRR